MKYISKSKWYYRNVYLLSEHWKRLRKEKLKINPICEICGAKKKIDVHHIRYRKLYNVLIEDLQTLCRKCHGSLHKRLNIFKRRPSLKSRYRGFKKILGG